MSSCILVIEDDAALRANVTELLHEESFEVIAAENGVDGIALAKARKPHLIICDIMLPGLDGHAVLRAVRQDPSTCAAPFIFLTAKAERADVRAGMDLGADDYLTKPFSLAELLSAVKTRLARIDVLQARMNEAVLIESKTRSHPPLAFDSAEGVVVDDARMQELYRQAARVAKSMINVLILGETGVGKEIFARAIHNLSGRSTGPFLALNCGALSESLLESELFGHEKGAFTGAFQARPGLLESAAGGTVFLDEVAELPLPIQSKLLRMLEERKVLRVGGRVPQSIDVRFVAATNKDVVRETARGTFRQDLYYRLCGVSFTVPPLRERKGELIGLARMFCARASAEQGHDRPVQIAPETARLLEAHDWPGNVRELKHCIELAVVLCEGDTLLPEHLPAGDSAGPPGAEPSSPDLLYSRYQDAANEEDRRRIMEALSKTGGNQTAAAALLGWSRRTLVYRLKALGLPRPRKRLPAEPA